MANNAQQITDSLGSNIKGMLSYPLIPIGLTINSFFYQFIPSVLLPPFLRPNEAELNLQQENPNVDPSKKSARSIVAGIFIMLLAIPAAVILFGLGLIGSLYYLIKYPIELIVDYCSGQDDSIEAAQPTSDGHESDAHRPSPTVDDISDNTSKPGLGFFGASADASSHNPVSDAHTPAVDHSMVDEEHTFSP